jgi:hypothetical protein
MAVLGLCILSGCTAPRAVEEHHHHHYEADTAAVSRQVDSRLQLWRSEIDSAFSERISKFISQQQQSEHQQETIQETVTETVDSLGRRIRQEQRTISRDISREIFSIEQQLTREYDVRLHSAVDSVAELWQSRYDSIAARVEQMDSTFVKKTPVGDARPWYQKLWDHIQWLFIGALLAAALWLTRKWWKKFL